MRVAKSGFENTLVNITIATTPATTPLKSIKEDIGLGC